MAVAVLIALYLQLLEVLKAKLQAMSQSQALKPDLKAMSSKPEHYLTCKCLILT